MKPHLTIDLSGDVGEGAGQDAAFIPLLTSANIACGGHAGDERSIVAALETSLSHGVHVGAHPGFIDREHFGRREMEVTAEWLFDSVTKQLDYFHQLANRVGASICHVKAHGALYHQSAHNPELADAFVRAIRTLPSPAAVVGPWQSDLEQATDTAELTFIREAFADRAYDPVGQLVPRSDSRALLTDPDRVIAQALQIIQKGSVTALDGSTHSLAADTLCLHGDTPTAILLATRLRAALQDAGVTIEPSR